MPEKSSDPLNDDRGRDAPNPKDHFIATLAHELRNPIASIDLAVHLLLDSDSVDHRLMAIDIIKRQNSHMGRLVDDLMDAFRLDRGRLQIRKERVDLGDVIGDATTAVRPIMDERRHSLEVFVHAASTAVDADPMRLQQIFVNLLTNSAKYTDAGGRITLVASLEGPEVVVAIRDTGRGITAEMLPHVFEMFIQDELTRDPAMGGLGVGLAIVKELVELHGGTVVATSQGRGSGSEFVVRLTAANRADG